MKKLKLKMYLSGAELLDREQMKQIMGGFIWDGGSGSGSGSGSGDSEPAGCGFCDDSNDNCGPYCGCSAGPSEDGNSSIYFCVSH